MAPFYGWGSTASRLQPLRGGSLLFTIQLPETPVLRLNKFLRTMSTHSWLTAKFNKVSSFKFALVNLF